MRQTPNNQLVTLTWYESLHHINWIDHVNDTANVNNIIHSYMDFELNNQIN